MVVEEEEKELRVAEDLTETDINKTLETITTHAGRRGNGESKKAKKCLIRTKKKLTVRDTSSP